MMVYEKGRFHNDRWEKWMNITFIHLGFLFFFFFFVSFKLPFLFYFLNLSTGKSQGQCVRCLHCHVPYVHFYSTIKLFRGLSIFFFSLNLNHLLSNLIWEENINEKTTTLVLVNSEFRVETSFINSSRMKSRIKAKTIWGLVYMIIPYNLYTRINVALS